MTVPALLTDLYELTMLAGYFDEEMHETPATFDLFFRDLPFQGSYAETDHVRTYYKLARF